MSIASRLLGVRAASSPATRAGTDNTRAPKGGASSVWYSTPGQPQIPLWDGLTALQNGYQASIYVMQPVRIIATALGSLPFRVGADPSKPGDYDRAAPLARLLGPPPHGPNPVTSPRNLWIWSIVQRLICGRMAWETVCIPGSDSPGAIWPLVAPFVQPVPSQPGSARWFDGYQYQLPAGRIDYTPREVFYSWRPSQADWRQPESALQAASMPTSLQVALDRYMWALAKNGLAAKKLVITPEFAEDDERRAWEEQFASEFTGYDNGGRVMHGYYEDDPNQSSTTGSRTPPIQVVDLAATPADAQVLEILKTVKDDMLRTWRVPMSWMGDSSQRTYENASQEARNFWQGPVMEAAAEIADDINMYLAPRFADGNVGWWDFSGVEALKGTSIFGPIDPAAAVTAGLIVADDWRNNVGLPPQNPDDVAAEALPAIDDSPGGTSMTNFSRRTDAPDAPAGPVAAGLAVKALDSGRVLMLQRALVESDPAAGTWEFPGGKLETGEDPLAAAVREWQEEVGCALPAGRVAGSWTSPNGVYRGFVYLVAAEASVACNLDHEDRHVLNPDDPDGDGIEVVAWWNPAQLPGMSALRPEARKGTDWSLLATADDTELARTAAPAAPADLLDCGHRAGTCTGPGPCDTAPFGAGHNWVNKVGGLPAYIRAIAHALHRSGHDESSAIATAVATVKRWAAGEGNVSAATRARAAKALAEWEAKKAAAHSRDAALSESSSAGALLPVAPMPKVVTRQHMFIPSKPDRRKCALAGCGKPVTAAVHGLTGRRHAGPGHHAVPTGHRSRQRRQTLEQVHRQADALEPTAATALAGLFAQQRKATLDRLNGRRGQQMLRAATPPEPPAGTEPPTPTSGRAPLVDAAQIYDFAHWAAKTRDAIAPVYGAVRALTADRFTGQLGEHAALGSLAAVGQVLDDRLDRLAQTITQTTLDQVAAVLRNGIAQGQTLQEMTAALTAVFDDGEHNRAPMIARTTVISSLNEAASTYADTLGTAVVAGHEWLSAHDDRVRPTHAAADGQVRAMGEPFLVGVTPMAFPGDPAAPADEVINCRCTAAFLTPAEYAKQTAPSVVAA